MSIVRNSRSSTNKTITVKRFVGGTAYDGGCKSVAYIQFKNTFMEDATLSKCWHFDKECTMLIKCELDAAATGGIIGSSNGLSIRVESGMVKWYNNTTVVHSVTLDSTRPHIYGFMSGEVGGNAGYYASYDGVCYGTNISGTVNIATVYVGVLSGTGYNADTYTSSSVGVINSTGTWAIRVYEIVGTMKYKVGSASPSIQNVHWYASKNASNVAVLHETRSDISTGSLNMTMRSSSGVVIGGDVTYGVQLHDLKDAFNSGYHDLMAIVCEDGGTDTDAGFVTSDYPSVLTKDNLSHNFAFYMNGVPANGATHSYAGMRIYEKGQLMYGHKTTWSIWNDSMINHGFYVIADGGTYLMKYNILKELDLTRDLGVKDTPICLEWFDGYNNSSLKKHEPFIRTTMGEEIILEFHNEVPAKCNKAAVLGGSLGNDYSTGSSSTTKIKDDQCVFFKVNGASGTVTFCAGNLIPWGRTATEMNRQYHVYGMIVKASYGSGAGYTLPMLFGAVEKESTPLDSTTTGDTKAKYQSTGVTSDFLLTGNFQKMVINILRPDGQTQPVIPLTLSLGLLLANTATPSDSQIINPVNLMPDYTMNLRGSYDPSYCGVSQDQAVSTNYRMIVESELNIAVVKGGSYYWSNQTIRIPTFVESDVVTGSGTTTRYYALYLPFVEFEGTTPSVPSVWANDEDYHSLFILTYQKYNSETGYLAREMNFRAKKSRKFDTISSAHGLGDLLTEWWGENLGNNSNKYLQRGNAVTTIVNGEDETPSGQASTTLLELKRRTHFLALTVSGDDQCDLNWGNPTKVAERLTAEVWLYKKSDKVRFFGYSQGVGGYFLPNRTNYSAPVRSGNTWYVFMPLAMGGAITDNSRDVFRDYFACYIYNNGTYTVYNPNNGFPDEVNIEIYRNNIKQTSGYYLTQGDYNFPVSQVTAYMAHLDGSFSERDYYFYIEVEKNGAFATDDDDYGSLFDIKFVGQ